MGNDTWGLHLPPPRHSDTGVRMVRAERLHHRRNVPFTGCEGQTWHSGATQGPPEIGPGARKVPPTSPREDAPGDAGGTASFPIRRYGGVGGPDGPTSRSPARPA